ncbi:hypothetical protein TREMEDRAFT_60113 [Tremella mesenterica DSM 1558]|uniref:uncharacterized protein n=1 Tax=Tremella mesenterica (strain ATCC 24925 / CBS 8224 / DSM 1558 / NBRC 9311 / NRRL Y-6157 / RJB 2259-6 / UBC 559-6) TaxID=578456 RepID=UPI0003F49EBF|nr:uncharacterized protein TREMEDRAFT_60113 [Tremella mesenterica DSM 1558]EIW71180.1 hypothetical protein TREMEDRAFT_60113 [Tremella mesenterica DSM 1558]
MSLTPHSSRSSSYSTTRNLFESFSYHSTVNRFPLYLESSHIILPTSPPVPHRRAPKPPIYKPRRHRKRHLRMFEPARSGLFTVCEEEELSNYSNSQKHFDTSTASNRNSDNMRESTDSLDVPQDVGEHDMEMDDLHSHTTIGLGIKDGKVKEEKATADGDGNADGDERRTSWESNETSGTNTTQEDDTLLTPNLTEDDDPFSSPMKSRETLPTPLSFTLPPIQVISPPTDPIPSLGSAFELAPGPSFSYPSNEPDPWSRPCPNSSEELCGPFPLPPSYRSAHPFSAEALACSSTLPNDHAILSLDGPLFRRNVPPPRRLDLDLTCSPTSLSSKYRLPIVQHSNGLLPGAEITDPISHRSYTKPTRIQSMSKAQQAHRALSSAIYLEEFSNVRPEEAFAALILEAGEEDLILSESSEQVDIYTFPLPPIRSTLTPEPRTPLSADLRTPEFSYHAINDGTDMNYSFFENEMKQVNPREYGNEQGRKSEKRTADDFYTPELKYPRMPSPPATPYVSTRKPIEYTLSSHSVLQSWSQQDSSTTTSSGSHSRVDRARRNEERENQLDSPISLKSSWSFASISSRSSSPQSSSPIDSSPSCYSTESYVPMTELSPTKMSNSYSSRSLLLSTTSSTSSITSIRSNKSDSLESVPSSPSGSRRSSGSSRGRKLPSRPKIPSMFLSTSTIV